MTNFGPNSQLPIARKEARAYSVSQAHAYIKQQVFFVQLFFYAREITFFTKICTLSVFF